MSWSNEMRGFLSAVVITMLAVSVSPGAAQSIEDKAAICTACHGEKGKPVSPEIPSIWGQNEGYIYIQLRDFKHGLRANELMNGVASSLEKEDMQALAKYFSEKTWTNFEQKSADAAVQHQAETIASSAQCPQCHLSGYVGDSVTPRVAGQSETYLLKTMKDFRSGVRKNNSWMTDLLRTFTDDDILVLSKYLAGL
jgi:cytochrome c553